MKLSDVEGYQAERSASGPNLGAIVTLPEFLTQTGTLTEAERRDIVEQAMFLLGEVYVHLPLKRAMHAIDPVQKLRLLRRRLGTLGEREFHNAMIEIFKGLRDLHTNYILPSPYRQHTAFLPFLMEEFYDDQGARHYIVSRLLLGFQHPTFREGSEITAWSGKPIDAAVNENAHREAGSNSEARHVRGLDAMTVRPMAMSLPPLEEWVIVEYETDGVTHELRLPWQVFRPDGATDRGGTGSEGVDQLLATMIGVDLDLELTNQARRELFVEGTHLRREQAETLRTRGAGGDARLEALMAEVSFFPDTFEFRTIHVGGRDVGYLRIRTFGDPDPAFFIGEVQRILSLLPQDGLIIDVRNNGGGIITNGERMLQLFTEGPVEAERLHFINNDVTLAIARSPAFGGFARAWARSIDLSMVTGAVYSQGFPIEDPDDTNAIGRVYPGPVVLVTDARCYSTTDIFAAGFQDNEIGPILGVDNNTGAGGANVFTHSLVRHVLTGTPFAPAPLPGGADMRVAIRQTTRVGANAGVPLEDLGVQPDRLHRLTRNDVLNDNADMIAVAAGMLETS